MLGDYCDGLDRRGFLRVGSVAGLSLAQLMQLQAAQGADKPRKDVNCIFIFIIGGMAHQDMWDPKPDAPAEIRGDFRQINSVVPGMNLTEILPHVAKVTDKLSIIRSMMHNDPDHTAGYHVMMTGQHPGTGPAFNRNVANNNVHPSLGSMVAKLGRSGALPPYISLPNFLNSGGPAFLGASCAPFVIEADPASPDFSVRDIVLPEGVTSARSVRRQEALRRLKTLSSRPSGPARMPSRLTCFSKRPIP